MILSHSTKNFFLCVGSTSYKPFANPETFHSWELFLIYDLLDFDQYLLFAFNRFQYAPMSRQTWFQDGVPDKEFSNPKANGSSLVNHPFLFWPQGKQ
jgi:hypothetical protein